MFQSAELTMQEWKKGFHAGNRLQAAAGQH